MGAIASVAKGAGNATRWASVKAASAPVVGPAIGGFLAVQTIDVMPAGPEAVTGTDLLTGGAAGAGAVYAGSKGKGGVAGALAGATVALATRGFPFL